jgi:hypothetical protein
MKHRFFGCLGRSRQMNKITWKLGLLVGAVLVFGAPNLRADSTLNLYSPGNDPVDGIYVGPYYAQINGVDTPVICDDFGDESYLSETWGASVSTVADLGSNVKWGSGNQLEYDEAAYLATLLASAPQSPNAAGLQYAIWQIFDPNGNGTTDPGVINYIGATSALETEVLGYISQAAGQNYTPGEYANVTVYSYDPSANPNGPMCAGSPCPSSPPQEFLVVNTPEPSTLLMLALGIGGLLLFARRQRNLAALSA